MYSLDNVFFISLRFYMSGKKKIEDSNEKRYFVFITEECF